MVAGFIAGLHLIAGGVLATASLKMLERGVLQGVVTAVLGVGFIVAADLVVGRLLEVTVLEAQLLAAVSALAAGIAAVLILLAYEPEPELHDDEEEERDRVAELFDI